jgi:hypothetical protein
MQHYLRFFATALKQPLTHVTALHMLHLFTPDKDGERCAWHHAMDNLTSSQ